MLPSRTFRKATELGIACAAVTTLILAGCGGGGGSSSSSGSASYITTSVTPYKGVFTNGTVILRDANGNLVTLVSGGAINASGVASVTYPSNVAYPLTIEVSGTFLDETSGVGATGTISAGAPLRGLIPAVADAQAASGVPVTLVTELARTMLPTSGFSAASAVAAITGAASSVLGATYGEAMTAPVFNSQGQTSNITTLKLTALAHVINQQGAGANLPARLQNIASQLAAGSAVNAVIPQSAFNNALGAINGGASSVLPVGATPPTMPTFTLPSGSLGGAIGGSGGSVGPTPSITGFNPTTGAVGTSVTITGTNLVSGFPPAPAFKFGTTNAGGPYTNVSNTSITFTVPAGLAAGAHTITVGGMSGSPVTVGTFTVTAGAVAAAPAPNFYNLKVMGASQVDMYWPAVSGATSYNIYRSTSPNVQIVPGNLVGSVVTAPFMTPYSDSGLAAATNYYYKVTSVDPAGESTGSTERSVQTLLWSVAPVILAGSTATPGKIDSATGTAARFGGGANGTLSMVADAAGNLYVTDPDNYNIRKITPAGVVTTFAGPDSATVCANPCKGNVDGTGTAARFWGLGGLTIDASGNLFVADTYNQSIRKITPAGVVTTFAGTYTVSNTCGAACFIVDANGTAARFNSPIGITIDASGNLYVLDAGNRNVRKITPAGDVTTLAGPDNAVCVANISCPSGYLINGTGTAARFNTPTHIAIDANGDLFVSDRSAGIRKITSAGVVSTFVAASYTGGLVYGDTGLALQDPGSIAIGASGDLYVADRFYTNRIRKITSAGVVSTGAAFSNGDRVNSLTVIGTSLYMAVGGTAGPVSSGIALQSMSGVAP